MPRLARIVGPAVLIVAALGALVAAVAYGGTGEPSLSLDPVARYGLPISTLFVNLGGAGVLGALVLALVAVDSGRPEFGRALDVAAGCAAVWTVAAAAAGFATFVSIQPPPLRFDDAFGTALASFLTGTELGQAWLVTTFVAAGVTVLCFAVRDQTAVVVVAITAAVGLVPVVVQGARVGSAVTGALVLQAIFTAIWFGGLLTLVLCRSLLDERRLAAVLRRYSTIAVLCSVVVVASSAVILIARPGTLLVLELAMLVVLGLLAAAHRGFVVERRGGASAAGRRVVVAELAVMGIAAGLAAALVQTAAPQVADGDPTPAEVLTGSPLPPPMSVANVLTLWNVDPVWALICASGILLYLLGVRRIQRRGERWAIHRTALWIVGMLLLFFATNGGVAVYERYLFSQQMLAQLLLGLAVPLLLAPGAPITLALLALRDRTDGSRGVREWIVIAVHSRPFAFLAHPIVAAILFAATPWVFSFTPVFSWATTSFVGHQWMIVHFVVTGYLFVQSLIGIDPSPKRQPYPVRLLIVLGAGVSLAVLGFVVMSSTGLLLADWYGAMGWEAGVPAIADQQAGGGIVWIVGGPAAIALALTVAALWRAATSEPLDEQLVAR